MYENTVSSVTSRHKGERSIGASRAFGSSDLRGVGVLLGGQPYDAEDDNYYHWSGGGTSRRP